MTRFWTTLMGALLIGGLAHAPAAQAQEQTRTLQAAYVTSLSFSPLFLAIENGYFDEENIAVELHIVQSASDVVALLGRGQLDLAFGNIGDSLFNAIHRGVDVKVVAGMSYYPEDPDTLSPAPILVRTELAESGEVKTMADLKGRKVAFNTRGGVIEYLAANGLRPAGLSVDDIEIVRLAFPDQIVALANAAIDAAVLPEPLATLSQQRGAARVLHKNPAPGALGTALLFGSNLLTGSDTAIGEAFLRALRRAANELQSPEAILSERNVAVWSKFTKVPAPVIAKTAPYVFRKDLALDVDNLLDQQRHLVRTGQIASELPSERLVDTRYAITTQ